METGEATLPHRIFHYVSETPTKTMFYCCDGRSVSYGEFGSIISELAERLRLAGAVAGDRVAIRLEDKLDFAVATFGVMSCGMVAVPLDTADSESQKWLVGDSGAKIFIGETSFDLEEASVSHVEWKAEAKESTDNHQLNVSGEDVGLILYTSGTEGVRKGVLLSHTNIVSVAGYVNDFMEVNNSVKEYVSSPLDHAFGFGRCRTVLATGGTVVFENGVLNPLQMLQSIKESECNACSGVSTTFGILADRFSSQLSELKDCLRWLKMGSIGLDEQSKARLLAALPSTRIFQNYGLTEAQRTTLLELRKEKDVLNSSGKTRGPCKVKICDENGQELPAGEVGRIHVKGPHVTVGYWNRPEEWKDKWDGEWLATSDLAHVDENGYLFFLSRSDEVINSGGLKISPVAVDGLLNRVIGDVEFATCGIPDPRSILGEAVCLCVTDAKFDWRGFQKDLSEKVEASFRPRYLAIVDEIPRTATGKVRRKILSKKAPDCLA